MVHRILVASYTNEIYTLAFDPQAPSLTLTSTITVGHHPSWITPHPTDKSIVFTALEQSEGKIVVTAPLDKVTKKNMERVSQPNAPDSAINASKGTVIVGGGSGAIHTIESLREVCLMSYIRFHYIKVFF